MNSCPTCRRIVQPLAEVIVVWVDEGELLHVLFGDEVQDLGHVSVLDDGHPLDGALAFDPHAADAVDAVAPAGAAQLPQAVEVGKSGHGVPRSNSGVQRKRRLEDSQPKLQLSCFSW